MGLMVMARRLMGMLVMLFGKVASLPLEHSLFRFVPTPPSPPKLVLIAGCTGTGKSTLGMNVALSEGILKCISTDTIREAMRVYDESPALHRSSYGGTGPPFQDYQEAAAAVDLGVQAIVSDAIKRGQSLVLEGVHILPSNDLIDRWKSAGGEAMGVLLMISEEMAHRDLIFKRGEMLKKGATAQLQAFARIRAIQDEMIVRATQCDWRKVEQDLHVPVDGRMFV